MTGGKRQRPLLGVVVLVSLLAQWAQAADVESVRLWRAPDNTRLVFDLSGPAEHTLFTLSNPERIVIDISNARLTANTGGLELDNTPLTGLRSAPRDGGDLRVVLDLSEAVNPKSFVLPPNQQYGDRLVVDLLIRARAGLAACLRPVSPLRPRYRKPRPAPPVKPATVT